MARQFQQQRAILSLHRVRRGYVDQRTAAINRVRGLLAEFGIVRPQCTGTYTASSCETTYCKIHVTNADRLIPSEASIKARLADIAAGAALQR